MSHPFPNHPAALCGTRNGPRQLAAGLLIAFGLATGVAHAADPAPAATGSKPASRPAVAKRASPAPSPDPKPIQPLLSREELRSCMSLQASNRENAADVQRMQPEIAAEKAELQRSGESMKAELTGLDRANADAVKDYNERAAARDRQIAQLETRISEFNSKLNAFETGRASYGRDCENRKYDEKDEKALLKQ